MSPTPMSPVDYQPTPSGQPPPAPAPAAKPAAPLPNPKRSARGRVLMLALMAAGVSLIWVMLVLLLPAAALTPLVPFGMGLVLGGGWAFLSFVNHQDEPFFPRLMLIGVFAAGMWAVSTSVLMLIGLHAMIAGGLTALALWVVSLTLPVWVIEIEPGEVLYFRPIHYREYRYDLICCPVERVPAELRQTDGKTTHALLRVMDPRYSGDRMAQITLAMDTRWVRPLDELRLLWKLEKTIVVDTHIRDIVTNDSSVFTLWIKVGANLDPTKIQGQSFLLQIPMIDSPARFETIMKGIIQDNIDKAAREYFIQHSVIDARGGEGVRGFRSQLMEMLRSLHNNLGLTFVESMFNSSPLISDEQRTAAEHAAASAEQARADLATTDALIERAMSGSAPHQLLLYTRLLERGAQFHVVPPAEQMPAVSPIDQFLWRISRSDPQAVQFLRSLAAAHPELPLPPSLKSVLEPPAPQAPVIEVQFVEPVNAQTAPRDSAPPGVPGGDETQRVPSAGSAPPSTLPETDTLPPPTPRIMPDFRRMMHTRRRLDGSYEVDFDADNKE